LYFGFSVCFYGKGSLDLILYRIDRNQQKMVAHDCDSAVLGFGFIDYHLDLYRKDKQAFVTFQEKTSILFTRETQGNTGIAILFTYISFKFETRFL